jgi:hypothetical protein
MGVIPGTGPGASPAKRTRANLPTDISATEAVLNGIDFKLVPVERSGVHIHDFYTAE